MFNRHNRHALKRVVSDKSMMTIFSQAYVEIRLNSFSTVNVGISRFISLISWFWKPVKFGLKKVKPKKIENMLEVKLDDLKVDKSNCISILWSPTLFRNSHFSILSRNIIHFELRWSTRPAKWPYGLTQDRLVLNRSSISKTFS